MKASERVDRRINEISKLIYIMVTDKPLLRIAKLMVEREISILIEIPYSVYNTQHIEIKKKLLNEELTEINNRLK